MDKWNFIKVKSFCTTKKNPNKEEVQLLEASLQVGSMAWGRCVKLALKLFKQVALNNLGRFYLYYFYGLVEQFYSKFCFL